MACHEIAALRLGLMNTLGIDDPAERKHEEDEIGSALTEPGPIAELTRSNDLTRILSLFQDSLVSLDEKIAATSADDPKLGYFRSLLILNRKVELELEGMLTGMTRFYADLERMHDLVHELHPAS